LVLTMSKPALWHMFNHMIDYLSLFSFQRSVTLVLRPNDLYSISI